MYTFREEFLDFVWRGLVPILALILLLFGGVYSTLVGIGYTDCRGFERSTGVKTWWYGKCYAKVGGQWAPKDFVFGTAHQLRIKPDSGASAPSLPTQP